MKIKTYGIKGLLEWHGIVSAGKIKMEVSFTNGSTTSVGVSPASFITKDELTQFVIENSDQFKNGRIILVREIEVPDDEATKARKKKACAGASSIEESTINPPLSMDGEDGAQEQADGDEETTGVEPIVVSDKSEAIEYLKEHFPERNYTATSLRGKGAFDAACSACGVVFVFTT